MVSPLGEFKIVGGVEAHGFPADCINPNFSTSLFVSVLGANVMNNDAGPKVWYNAYKCTVADKRSSGPQGTFEPASLINGFYCDYHTRYELGDFVFD